MTLYQPGATVRCFRDFGTVKRVLGGGYAYKVEFPGLGEVTCMASALVDAPSNVTPFKRPGQAATDAPRWTCGERINCVSPVPVVSSNYADIHDTKGWL